MQSSATLTFVMTSKAAKFLLVLMGRSCMFQFHPTVEDLKSAVEDVAAMFQRTSVKDLSTTSRKIYQEAKVELVPNKKGEN